MDRTTDALIPIHELLSRIRWDPEFGRGRLEIGFFDRHEGVIHGVAFLAFRAKAQWGAVPTSHPFPRHILRTGGR